MHILLTGAGGFVGSHVLEHLIVNTDAQLTLTDSFRHRGISERIVEVLDTHPGSRDRAHVITHDLTAPWSSYGIASIRERGDVDAVLQVASESHVDRSITDPIPFVRNNVDIALNMLELARELKPRAYLHLSTDEVYGPAPLGRPSKEWDAVLPSNPYCLAPDTDIISRRGPIRMDEFSVTRDRVLSRRGSSSDVAPNQATHIWRFRHTGKMLRIRTREGSEEILCTYEHKFFKRVSSHASGGSKMVEVRAGDLRVGSRVAIVREVPFEPDCYEVEPEYARLLGYWLADGSYSESSRYVRFADQNRERLERYRDMARTVLGISSNSPTGDFGTIYRHGTKNGWYLQFASEALRERIDLSSKQAVLDQVLNWGAESVAQFIAGWIDGDGSLAYRGDALVGVDISCFAEAQRRLLKFLYRRLGVVSVNYDSSRAKGVKVSDSESLQRIARLVPTDKIRSRTTFRRGQAKRGKAQKWMWARIESIEEEEYEGRVYDLEVPGHHNYLANYFLVHNSASKAAQEAISMSYWRTYGVPLILVNAMNLIGERQHPEKFIPKTIVALVRGEKVVVHCSASVVEAVRRGGAGALKDRSGISSRCYLHARNLADAMLFLIRTIPGSALASSQIFPPRFHVVGEAEVDNLTMAERIAEFAGKPLVWEPVDFHSSRPGHDLRYAMDGQRLHDLGWRPPVPLWDSLRHVVQWSLDHPRWLAL
jgi:dTDP-D-glucose 4,6-dehydratase